MKKVSKNFLSLFLSDALSRLLGFFATVYIARMLSVEGFGLIHYGLAFLTYAMLFTNPGITTIGAREIARDRSNQRLIFEILGLRLTSSMIILLLCFAGLLVIPGDALTKRIILIYLFVLLPYAILLEFVFQGREEMEYIGITRTLQSATYLVLLLVFVIGKTDLLMVPLSYIIAYCVTTGFLVFVFILRYHGFQLRFSTRFWWELLVVSTPVGLATILNQAALNLPPLVLGILYTKESVGEYSAAYKIILMLLIVERVFHYISFPIISKQFTTSPKKLATSFTLLTRILSAITIPCAIGGIILADRMVMLIYGPGYEGAVLVLRFLLLYFLVTPLNSVFGYGLVSINKEKRFLKVITITSLCSGVLIIILGMVLNAPGTAIALVIGEFIGITLMYRELRKSVQFGNLQYFLKPLIAGVIMGVVLYGTHILPLTIIIPVGLVVYLVIAYIIKVFTLSEIKAFQNLFIP